MPLDDIFTFDFEDAFNRQVAELKPQYAADDRVVKPEAAATIDAYETVARTLLTLYDQKVRDLGWNLREAHQAVFRNAWLPPFFSGSSDYETALAHLQSIAQAQQEHLRAYGIATAHEASTQ